MGLRLNSSEQYWHSDSCPKALWRSCIALGLLVLIVYTDGAIICDVCAAVPSGEPVCKHMRIVFLLVLLSWSSDAGGLDSVALASSSPGT